MDGNNGYNRGGISARGGFGGRVGSFVAPQGYPAHAQQSFQPPQQSAYQGSPQDYYQGYAQQPKQERANAYAISPQAYQPQQTSQVFAAPQQVYAPQVQHQSLSHGQPQHQSMSPSQPQAVSRGGSYVAYGGCGPQTGYPQGQQYQQAYSGGYVVSPQVQSGYFNAQCVPPVQNAYAGYRGRGGHHNQQGQGYSGGYASHSAHHHGRGRGAGGFRARGRGSGSAGFVRMEQYFLVHIDSFAKLEGAGRKNTFDDALSPFVLQKMSRMARGSPVRALVIVEKRYLAACVSFPRTPDDVILSQATATTFMDVQHVLCDDGSRIIEADSADHVAKHLFLQLRIYLCNLVSFDKPAADVPNLDVYSMDVCELRKGIVTNRTIYEAVIAAMSEDSDRSTELFISLLGESSRPPQQSTDGQSAETQANPAETDSPAPDSAASPSAKSISSYHVSLLTSAQGVKVLDTALHNPAKRRAFFSRMKVCAKKIEDDDGAPVAVESSDALFRAFFAGILTSRIVFRCFGVRFDDEDTEETIAMQEEEVIMLCECFSVNGILVVCGNGGSSMLNALVKALRPNYKTHEKAVADAAAARKARISGKRVREEANVNEESRQQRVEDEPRTTGALEELPDSAPTSIEAYTIQDPPSDWRLFYACAAAFTSGSITRSRAAAVEGDNSNAIASRVQLLTEHVVGCRAVQALVPHFADSLLEREKMKGKEPVSEACATYYTQCEAFLKQVATRCKELMVHNFGNYVIQTLITELSTRCVPQTPVDQVLRTVLDVVVDNIFDLSVQKYASNCVDKSISATLLIMDGRQLILRLGRALMEKGDSMMVHVASNQFGNYTVRHLCEKLTQMATASEGTIDALEVEEAKGLELTFFRALTAHRAELHKTVYGVGIVGWLHAQSDRLDPAAKK